MWSAKFRGKWCATLAGAVLLAALPVTAQEAPGDAKPYATLNRDAVTYRGPSSNAGNTRTKDHATIGLILPLQGQREAEGKSLLAAAQLAIEEEQATGPLPGGATLALAVRDDSGPWGQASVEILKLVETDASLAVITSANGNIAHQAEQLSNKISFPIFTLASDSTTTQVNIPWIFRIVPSDEEQAKAIVQRLAKQGKDRRILLIAEKDHDGREGADAFRKAARAAGLAEPEVCEVEPESRDFESLTIGAGIEPPTAVVLWVSPQMASGIQAVLREIAPSAELYFSSKSAQLLKINGSRVEADATAAQGEVWNVAALPRTDEAPLQSFAARYRQRTGDWPGTSAVKMYDIVHAISRALRDTDADRIRLREFFALGAKYYGVATVYQFDAAGNMVTGVEIRSAKSRIPGQPAPFAFEAGQKP